MALVLTVPSEGGPIPTQFRFNTGDDFIREGTVLEKGSAHSFYDSLYEMDITWYSNAVLFQQNVRLINPVKAITGTIEYMTCNDELCIPAEREFIIPLRQ